MANTKYLRYAVEPWVRQQLERQYGKPFHAKVLPLSPGGAHEFDAVSGDGSIVGSIKANSGLTSGGNHPTGKVATVLNEVYFLTLVEAQQRLLVLTNPEFHEIFVRTTRGQIVTDVEILLVPLPPGMQAIVDGVVRVASQEMSGSSATREAAVVVEEAGERGEDLP
jgi:hypothetical protein